MKQKPYLIIPFLVEQPTWGGSYICEKKGWLNKKGLEGKKIGQSYELYSKSLLSSVVTSTEDKEFSCEMAEIIPISVFNEDRPFPLIKFTQAKGNSFQLHIKPTTHDPYWQPKAESWYYFENGKITFGVKKGASMEAYQSTCLVIEKKMKELSALILQGVKSVGQAEGEAKKFIAEKNPWQFVNVYDLKGGDVVDLSGGGLHHSWEEDANNPLGNIVYEVQQDVMDPVSTIRSFDQGKFTKGGGIREIQIKDYFKHIDTDEIRNTLHLGHTENDILFDTPYYMLKKVMVEQSANFMASTSFHHIFVKEGKITVVAKEGEVCVSRGHSCFIPKGITYEVVPDMKSELLLTYLN